MFQFNLVCDLLPFNLVGSSIELGSVNSTWFCLHFSVVWSIQLGLVHSNWFGQFNLGWSSIQLGLVDLTWCGVCGVTSRSDHTRRCLTFTPSTSMSSTTGTDHSDINVYGPCIRARLGTIVGTPKRPCRAVGGICPEAQHPEPGTRNPQPGIRNPKVTSRSDHTRRCLSFTPSPSMSSTTGTVHSDAYPPLGGPSGT